MNDEIEKAARLTEPFMFVTALRHARKRFERHPHWKRLVGTPWENDAAVIGADLMSDVAREYEAANAALEARVRELEEALKPEGFYVASRASLPLRPIMWRRFRDDYGEPIISTWIDEAGEGETESNAELWGRILDEIKRSACVLLYAESGDFPLKGALIEVGMALGMGKPVIACLPGVTLSEPSLRPVGSWMAHPLVERIDDIEDALRRARSALQGKSNG